MSKGLTPQARRGRLWLSQTKQAMARTDRTHPDTSCLQKPWTQREEIRNYGVQAQMAQIGSLEMEKHSKPGGGGNVARFENRGWGNVTRPFGGLLDARLWKLGDNGEYESMKWRKPSIVICGSPAWRLCSSGGVLAAALLSVWPADSCCRTRVFYMRRWPDPALIRVSGDVSFGWVFGSFAHLCSFQIHQHHCGFGTGAIWACGFQSGFFQVARLRGKMTRYVRVFCVHMDP